MLTGLVFVKICKNLHGAMSTIALIETMHLMTCFISIISRRVPIKIIRRQLTDKTWFDNNCINVLMTNRILIVFGSVIGPSCCGKSTLDDGVMPRLFITLHILNIITVIVNLLPKLHIYIKGGLQEKLFFQREYLTSAYLHSRWFC